ncbi:MAG TPA: RNA 2',3'-cyclic phosphodiesterase [Rhizomicrobium sp.]|jgi:2'-5' RNA ligase|nr:RNA 2',3'-cyclic phosphodiesterase [Rhizomicrobium sp.]
MERLFVALAIPDAVAQSLALIQSGVPGAHWQSRAQLHLTLRFIGEVDGREAAMIGDALAAIDAPAFALELHGTGEFGGKHPHALWAGVRASEPLLHLQKKVDSAIRRAGYQNDREKFTPHVTVARLGHTPVGTVMDYLTDHALYSSAPFAVAEFILYSSVLTSDGSVYRPEREYPLR